MWPIVQHAPSLKGLEQAPVEAGGMLQRSWDLGGSWGWAGVVNMQHALPGCVEPVLGYQCVHQRHACSCPAARSATGSCIPGRHVIQGLWYGMC